MNAPPYSSTHLGPFFTAQHAALSSDVHTAAPKLPPGDATAVAHALGREFNLYRYLLPTAVVDHSAAELRVDVRSLVIIREVLGYHHPLADALFAVQGLGTYPLVLRGSEAQKQTYLTPAIAGERIAAFALTEPNAGSDVASLRCRAALAGDAWQLDGEKRLISNVPIAHHYIVFANADPKMGRKGISAFIVQRDDPGLTLTPQPMSIAHPIGRLQLRGCRIPQSRIIGNVGDGFKLAMQTLDTFRIGVGAAANGMASAALADTIAHVRGREQFGKPLAQQQLVQSYLADMATQLAAARLLVARAAHHKDTRGGRRSAEAAMAKMYATEAAQRIIDKAVQLHGGSGVLSGTRVEALYRDIRPLRIYEGTTEIQQLIIARELLRD